MRRHRVSSLFLALLRSCASAASRGRPTTVTSAPADPSSSRHIPRSLLRSLDSALHGLFALRPTPPPAAEAVRPSNQPPAAGTMLVLAWSPPAVSRGPMESAEVKIAAAYLRTADSAISALPSQVLPDVVIGRDMILSCKAFGDRLVRAVAESSNVPESTAISARPLVVLGIMNGVVETRLRSHLRHAIFVRLSELAPSCLPSAPVLRVSPVANKGPQLQKPPRRPVDVIASFRMACHVVSPAVWMKFMLQSGVVHATGDPVAQLLHEMMLPPKAIGEATTTTITASNLVTGSGRFLLHSFAAAVHNVHGAPRLAVLQTPPLTIEVPVGCCPPAQGAPASPSPRAPSVEKKQKDADSVRAAALYAPTIRGDHVAQVMNTIPELHLRPGDKVYTIPRTALLANMDFGATHSMLHGMAASAWHWADSEFSSVGSIEVIPPPRTAAPEAVQSPSPVTVATVSAQLSLTDFTVVAVALYHDYGKLSFSACRMFPPPKVRVGSNVLRQAVVTSVPYGGESEAAAGGASHQWIPAEVDAFTSLSGTFTNAEGAENWAAASLAPSLLRMCSASRPGLQEGDRKTADSYHKHCVLLVLTSSSPQNLDLLTAMVARASSCAETGGRLPQLQPSERFSFGWTHAKTFWPKCVNQGHVHQFAAAWQREQFTAMKRSFIEVKQALSAFVPDSPAPTANPFELSKGSRSLLSRKERFLAYVNSSIWNASAGPAEAEERNKLMRRFACVTYSPPAETSTTTTATGQPAAGGVPAPGLFARVPYSPVLCYRGTLQESGLDALEDLSTMLVVHNGTGFLRQLWNSNDNKSGSRSKWGDVEMKIRRFLNSGGRLWCLSYGHHLLAGFGSIATKPSLQQLATMYASPSEVLEARDDERKLLAVVFRKQTLMASAHMRQLRIVSLRMPMVATCARMERSGLALASKAQCELTIERKRQERDTAADALRAMLPKNRNYTAATLWNPRAQADVAMLLFGGVSLRALNRIVPDRAGKSIASRDDSVAATLLQRLARCHCGEGTAAAVSALADDTSVVVLSVPQRNNATVAISVCFIGKPYATLQPSQHLVLATSGSRTNTSHTIHSAIQFLASHPCVAELKRRREKSPGGASQAHEVIILVEGCRHEQAVIQHLPLVSTLLGGSACMKGVSVVCGPALVAATSQGTSFADDFRDMMVCSDDHNHQKGRGDALWQSSMGSATATVEDLIGTLAAWCSGPSDDGRDPFSSHISLSQAFAACAKSADNTETNDTSGPSLLPGVTVGRLLAAYSLVPQFGGELPGLILAMSTTDQVAVLSRGFRDSGLSLNSEFLDFLDKFVRDRPSLTAAEPTPTGSQLLEAVAALGKLRKADKTFSSELFSLAVPGRGGINGEVAVNYLRTEFDVFGTATGRLASSRPNILNIPLDVGVRGCFVSRFGLRDGLLVELDYSQLEVTILAVLARDPKMLRAIQGQQDFHCMRVSLMTKIPYAEVVAKVRSKDPVFVELRQKAKIFSFQRQYGAGTATIAESSGLSMNEIETLIREEDAAFKGVGSYVELVTASLDQLRPLIVSYRMSQHALDEAFSGPPVPLAPSAAFLTEPARYFQIPTGTKFSFAAEAYGPHIRNYPVQGFAAEVVQLIVIQIDQLLASMNGGAAAAVGESDVSGGQTTGCKAYLINTVHDSVWLDVHRSVAPQVISAVKAVMEAAPQTLTKLFPHLMFDVPMPVTVKAGPTLGDMSEDSVPLSTSEAVQ